MLDSLHPTARDGHGIRVSISATFLDATINRHADETNRLHGWRHSVQVDQPPPLIHYALQHNPSRPRMIHQPPNKGPPTNPFGETDVMIGVPP